MLRPVLQLLGCTGVASAGVYTPAHVKASSRINQLVAGKCSWGLRLDLSALQLLRKARGVQLESRSLGKFWAALQIQSCAVVANTTLQRSDISRVACEPKSFMHLAACICWHLSFAVACCRVCCALHSISLVRFAESRVAMSQKKIKGQPISGNHIGNVF